MVAFDVDFATIEMAEHEYALSMEQTVDADSGSFLLTGSAPDLLDVVDEGPTAYDAANRGGKARPGPTAAAGRGGSHLTFHSSIKSSGYGASAPKKPGWASSRPPPAAATSLRAPVSALPHATYPDDGPVPSIFDGHVWGSAAAVPVSSAASAAGAPRPASAEGKFKADGPVARIALSHDGADVAISTHSGAVHCARLAAYAPTARAASARPVLRMQNGSLQRRLWAAAGGSATAAAAAASSTGVASSTTTSARASAAAAAASRAAAAAAAAGAVSSSLSWSAGCLTMRHTRSAKPRRAAAGAVRGGSSGSGTARSARSSGGSTGSADSGRLADLAALLDEHDGYGDGDDGSDSDSSDGGGRGSGDEAAGRIAAGAASSGSGLPPSSSGASASRRPKRTARLLLGAGSGGEACMWLGSSSSTGAASAGAGAGAAGGSGGMPAPVLVLRPAARGDMRPWWKLAGTGAGSAAASAASAAAAAAGGSASASPTVSSACFYYVDRFALLAHGAAVSACAFSIDAEAIGADANAGGPGCSAAAAAAAAARSSGGGSGGAGSAGTADDVLRLRRAGQPRSTFARVAWWQAAPEGATVIPGGLLAHNAFRSPLVVAACSDRSVRVFDVAVAGSDGSGGAAAGAGSAAAPVAQVLALLEAHERPITAAALPPASPFAHGAGGARLDALLTASSDGGGGGGGGGVGSGCVKLWDLRAGVLARRFAGAHGASGALAGAGRAPGCLAMSPDGLYVAVCSDDRSVAIYDVRAEGRPAAGAAAAVARLRGAGDVMTALAWHPQLPVLLAGALDGTVLAFAAP